jgi:hypothetical protein
MLDQIKLDAHLDKSAGATGCWIYTGSLSDGYGNYWRNNRWDKAHRVAFESHWGITIPPGMEIMHVCNNRACCNPAHLVCGSRYANQFMRRICERIGPRAYRYARKYNTGTQPINFQEL